MKLATRIAKLLLPVALCVAAAGPASAQATYPSKPIRLVVPYPPGGTGDTVARMVVTRWSELLKQTIVVDNRGGAGSNIGIDLVAKASPDGYTIGLFDTALFVNPALYGTLPFDVQRDLLPITVAARGPLVLTVHPSLPANTLAELLALARAKPGGLSYASAGSGTPVHLAAEMLKSAAGLDIVHVPYKGAGPAVLDVVGGQVPMFFALPGTARPHIAAGKLRPLAITGAKRFKDLPSVPTFAEAGVQGVDATLVVGFLAPARTPPAVVKALYDALHQVLASPDIVERLGGLALDVVGSDPERSATIVREIAVLGGSTGEFVHPLVERRLRDKVAQLGGSN